MNKRQKLILVISLLSVFMAVILLLIFAGDSPSSGMGEGSHKDGSISSGSGGLAGLLRDKSNDSGIPAAEENNPPDASQTIEPAPPPESNPTTPDPVNEPATGTNTTAPEPANNPILNYRDTRALDSLSLFQQYGFDTQNQGEGNRFIFIIDKSGSMKGGRFAAAQNALIQSLRRLRPGKSFFLFMYDDKSEQFPSRRWLTASNSDKNAAIRWIQQASTGGGTNPLDYMKNAFGMKPSTIWLLSDGKFTDENGVVQLIRSLNRNKAVRVNTMALVDDVGGKILQQIAAENRGAYRFIKN